jgi:hypothetical protein
MKFESFKQEIKAIWKGEAEKSIFLKYFFCVFSIYVLGAIYAMIMYPGGFSFTGAYTSYLGGNIKNPNGYLVYNTSEMITGILLVPNFLYLYKHLRGFAKPFVFITCVFGIIGSLGFASLGIYYEGFSDIGHSIATILAFGGFGISCFFFLILYILRLITKQKYPSWKQFLLLYFGTFSLLILALFLTIWKSVIETIGIPPEYFKDQFTEWIFLLVVVYWLITHAIIAPQDKTESKKE